MSSWHPSDPDLILGPGGEFPLDEMDDEIAGYGATFKDWLERVSKVGPELWAVLQHHPELVKTSRQCVADCETVMVRAAMVITIQDITDHDRFTERQDTRACYAIIKEYNTIMDNLHVRLSRPQR